MKDDIAVDIGSLFSSFLDVHYQGIIIIEKKSDIDKSKIIYGNSQIFDLFGYNTDEIVKLDFGSIFPYSNNIHSNSNSKSLITEFQLVLTKNGEKITVELIYREIDIEGTAYLIIGINKMNKDKQDEELLLNILKNTPNHIHLLDIHGNFKYSNQESGTLKEFDINELNVFDLIIPELKDKFLEVYSTAISTQSRQVFYGVSKFGEVFNNIIVPFVKNSIVEDVILYAVDITELEEARIQLQHKQKLSALGLVAGGIAHDFNNLFMGIIGNTSLLMEINNDSEIDEILHDIINITSKASELSTQMLTFSGKPPANIESNINMNTVIDDLIGFIKSITPPPIKVEYIQEKGLPTLLIDVAQLNQVIKNLVTNAVESIDDEGKITIKTCFLSKNNTDYVCLEIKDSGCGINKKNIDKIFDPFYTTKFAGRGLGLSVVSGILDRMNCHLEVKSVVERGSTFTVFLPISSEKLSNSQKLVSRLSNTKSGKILLIDDDRMIRNTISRMLKLMDYDVVEAVNGKDAIAKYNSSFDLLICDLTMPEMDGVTVSQLIHEINPDQLIILTSGYHVSNIGDVLNNPNVQFIQKPYSFDNIRDLLSSFLSSKI